MPEMNHPTEASPVLAQLEQPTGRRSFLRAAGIGAVGLAAAACDPERTRTITEIQTDTVRILPPAPPTFQAVTLNFTDDFGVLNYAYALEQLEAAFFTQVIATPYAGMSAAERQVFTDLRDHEVVHREFFRAAIPALGGMTIPGLTPNFAAVDFNSRISVLTTARILEDLGVGAYNGAGQFLKSATLLGIAGKIVSNEARHAAAVRDLINRGSRDFAPRAFDDALPPSVVLSAAAPFIQNRITLTNVPAFVSLNLQA